jgi:hypothetical protein
LGRVNLRQPDLGLAGLLPVVPASLLTVTVNSSVLGTFVPFDLEVAAN